MSPVNLDSAVVDLRMTIKVWIWCLSLLSTNFIHSNSLIDELSPRLCALISYILISSLSDAYFWTGNRKNTSQRKFLGRALFSSLLMFFWPFYSFFSFCFNFWGRGAAAVRLLLRSPPLHQLSHLFPEFPEFSPIYLQSPPVSMFHCHNATELNLIVNVSQKVWNLFRLNWHKFETSVVLHEINWKFRFCIKYVGSFEIVKAVAFWLSGCCCCWLQKQIMKVDHTAGVPSQWESKIKRAESYNKQKCSLSTIFRWHHKKNSNGWKVSAAWKVSNIWHLFWVGGSFGHSLYCFWDLHVHLKNGPSFWSLCKREDGKDRGRRWNGAQRGIKARDERSEGTMPTSSVVDVRQ